jgi:hypothetical protein
MIYGWRMEEEIGFSDWIMQVYNGGSISLQRRTRLQFAEDDR